MKILIFGIGNPGRQDDGLGSLLVEEIQRAVTSGEPGSGAAGGIGPGREDHGGLYPARHEFSFDSNYQLNIEDAEAISHHDVVVFADASTEEGGPDQPFRFSAVEPERTASFSTHSVSPGGVVALCSELYGSSPRTYMLAIRGAEWGVNEPLSSQARQNLEAATRFLLRALRAPMDDTDAGGHSLLDQYC